MLDVEYQSQPVDEDKVMDVFQAILSSDLSIEFKVKISQRRMEFLEDFGTCVKRWAEPQPAHSSSCRADSDQKFHVSDFFHFTHIYNEQ